MPREFVVGFSLKKLLIQVPAGIVAVWIASKIFDFDFGTIGSIAQEYRGHHRAGRGSGLLDSHSLLQHHG